MVRYEELVFLQTPPTSLPRKQKGVMGPIRSWLRNSKKPGIQYPVMADGLNNSQVDRKYRGEANKVLITLSG